MPKRTPNPQVLEHLRRVRRQPPPPPVKKSGASYRGGRPTAPRRTSGSSRDVALEITAAGAWR